MRIWLVLIGSASAGIIAALVTKMMGVESSAMIGGAVGGACGALVAIKLKKK